MESLRKLLVKEGLLLRKAHRPHFVTPKALREGHAFMTYKVDAGANNSKFYEGMIQEQPDGTWSYQRRWGALTDTGPDQKRVDGAKLDKFGLDYSMAKRLLMDEYSKRIRQRGYSDAMKTRPLGQYPVGLSRDVGFGWGTQKITQCVPQLRDFSELINQAVLDVMSGDAGTFRDDMQAMKGLLDTLPNSSMALEIGKLLRPPLSRLEQNPRFLADPKKTQSELTKLRRYIDRQIKECNV